MYDILFYSQVKQKGCPTCFCSKKNNASVLEYLFNRQCFITNILAKASRIMLAYTINVN